MLTCDPVATGPDRTGLARGLTVDRDRRSRHNLIHGDNPHMRFSGLRLLLPLCALALAGLAQQPPVLDRELFFGDPEITTARISPDGKYIAFLKPLNGTRNIWVKGTEEPFSAAKPITNDTNRPIREYFWSRDGKYVLFVQDHLGDENFNVYAVNPADAKDAASVPAARNLTDAKGARAVIFDVPKTDPDVIYIGLNDRDKAWHDLYKFKISSGDRTLLRKNTDRVSQWVFDNAGQLRIALRSEENGNTDFLRVDPDGLHQIYSCDVFEICQPLHFNKDGKRVYIMTNHGERDFIRLALLDLASGREELVESDPKNRVDLDNAEFSDLIDDLLATVYNDEKPRYYFRDKSIEADYKLVRGKLGGKEITPVSKTKDERIWLISAWSDVEPGETYLFNRDTKQLTLEYRIREKLPREDLARMEPIRYESSDGKEVPAYLTLPKGVPAKNLPLIVFPHGGPWGRDEWRFDTFAQFLANRGYAVLQPNFRASTGYGKKFLNAGNLQWGDKMQDDITWGVKYLVAKGTADPKRVGIMGGSYGGYATLAGVAFTPDLYSAAVAIVAPSNLITLLGSIPPYWEAGRMMFYKRMGDPRSPEGKAQLMRQSPLNSAAKIRTPLMIVQGANDPRVNKAESEQIVIALRDRGFPVQYLLAPDEGHGFARPVNNLAMMMASEKFLAERLGGRYQEGGTPEVVARLKEITVDPKTVVLAKKVEASSVAAPKIAGTLAAGTWNYDATLSMGTQSAKLKLTTDIKDDPAGYVATETASTPMGDMTDSDTLDKSTLAPLKREVKQGPVAFSLAFADGKATGTMSTNGQDKPISVTLTGPLFADGAGSLNVLGCLPLADGYSVVFRNFDVQKQQEKLMQLKVTATESVKVAGGAFDAWKAVINPADGSPGTMTVWIDKATRTPVRFEAAMPEMGGATMVAELVQ